VGTLWKNPLAPFAGGLSEHGGGDWWAFLDVSLSLNLNPQVCGYVRFAPKCVGQCEDVFPEYRETNFGQPELQGDVKITGGTGVGGV